MLFRAIYYSVCRGLKVAEYEGIQIASSDGVDFGDMIVRALKLIHQSDAKRFARVQRHVRWIVNSGHADGFGAASYNWYLRQCKIDLVGSDFEQLTDEYVPHLASVVVHEATHGHLRSMGFKYQGDKRKQHERICCAEQNRFLKRADALAPGSYERYHRKFDAHKWTASWRRGRVESTVKLWHRTKDIWRQRG